MAFKYNSREAHNLVKNIGESNIKLISVGKKLIELKNINEWKDVQYKNYENMINESLKNLGQAINYQNAYKTELESKIKELEN